MSNMGIRKANEIEIDLNMFVEVLLFDKDVIIRNRCKEIMKIRVYEVCPTLEVRNPQLNRIICHNI